MELAIRTAMTRLGGSLLEQLLAADTGHRGPRIDCGAGHQAGFVSYRAKTIDTVLGPISVDRAYYHCAPCRRGVLPKDDELGLTGGSLSPGLRAMVARTGAATPFAKASTLLSELAGITLTTKRVERSAEADGQQLAARIDTEAAAILNGKLVPLAATTPVAKLYIAARGTGVPMVAAETTGRAGKAAEGRAHTREVKLGVLFTQTNVDAKGRPVRDPGSSSYLATLEPVEQFGSLVYAEARRRGSHYAQQLVVLGDGAPWIWNLASKHFPTATQIVDLYHARALTLPEVATEAVDKALGYFQTNAERMGYAHFHGRGHFVGSGAIETGCKAVVDQRLKLSGMRWNVRGATGIVTLRCQEASGRWDEIWSGRHNQTSMA